MSDLTWEDVKEWKTKQYDCDDGRLIQFDDDCINWLMQEVKRLKAIEAKYESYLQQPDCGECGHTLEEVRPGKHQCSYCELEREVERLKPFEHEYICKKCGIRQNSCQEPPTF